MTIQELQVAITYKISQYRTTERFLADPAIIRLFKTLSPDIQIMFEKAALEGNKETLRKILHRDFRSITDLKQEAQELGISNWSRMCKDELLERIDKCRRAFLKS